MCDRFADREGMQPVAARLGHGRPLWTADDSGQSGCGMVETRYVTFVKPRPLRVRVRNVYDSIVRAHFASTNLDSPDVFLRLISSNSFMMSLLRSCLPTSSIHAQSEIKSDRPHRDAKIYAYAKRNVWWVTEGRGM